MSILVEIAGKADVSVEGVVRVLTREPVSSAVKERVLAVLDQLDGEQTRVLERFALAAVHDVVPLEPDDELAPPEEEEEETDDSPPAVHEGQLALGESPPPQHPTLLDGAPATELDRPLDTDLPVGLGTLLEELVSTVWEMRHERRSDRQERLDDLAVLVDLMTTSWQGVDRRLARLEQLLARREANWHAPVPVAAPVEAPPLLQRVPEPPPAEPPPPTAEEPAPTRRSWPPFAGTLLLLACLVGVMLVFDLLPSRAEGPSFVPASENGSVPPPATGTGASATQSQSTQPAATRPEPTTQPEAKQPGSTQPAATQPGATRPSPRARTTGPARSTRQAPAAAPPQRPRGTTTGATPASPAATTGSSAIQPARVFVWPPHADAVGYSVRFFRGGDDFYSARVTEPRLTIPKRVVFRPGTYRWVVVPDRGPLGLGEPIIDSSFTVAKP